MTRTDTRRAPVWLTPGLAVVAVAAAGVLGVGYARTVQHVRQAVTAPAPASAPSSAPATATYTIGGTLRLQPGQHTADGDGCRSTTLGPDAEVIVSDRAGTVLAQSRLGAGKLAAGRCELPFTLTVPVGAGTYGLDVPSWGQQTYTEKELAGLLTVAFG